MDLLAVLSLAVGAFLVGLVAVAMLVAGWELLRQRELLDRLRRDRAVYAATSPLPLAAATRADGTVAAGAARAAMAAAMAAAPAAAAAKRDLPWTETRPMVLSFAPAADDETAPRRRELDLQLD